MLANQLGRQPVGRRLSQVRLRRQSLQDDPKLVAVAADPQVPGGRFRAAEQAFEPSFNGAIG